MEKFISLAITMILITWYYINSLKINTYFKNAHNWTFSVLSVFIFTYLFFTVFFLFLDSMTISPDKEFLNFKEDFILNFLLIFEIYILIIAPITYIFLLAAYEKGEIKDKKSNTDSNLNYEVNINNITKPNNYKLYLNIIFYIIYLILLFCLNIFYLKIDLKRLLSNKQSFSYDNDKNEVIAYTYYGDKVPFSLRKYSTITHEYQKIIYFNLGLLMMLGKFLGFTYMPYGMSLLVHHLIFRKEDNKNKSPFISDGPDIPSKTLLYSQELYDKDSFNDLAYNKNYIPVSLEEKDIYKRMIIRNSSTEDKLQEEVRSSNNNDCNNEVINEFQSKNNFYNAITEKKYLIPVHSKNYKYENDDYDIIKIKRSTLKKEKDYSEELSDKSNFFSKCKSKESKNCEENNNHAEGSKSDSYKEVSAVESLDETIIKQKRKISKKLKSKSEIFSKGLISIEVKSKKSSLKNNENKSSKSIDNSLIQETKLIGDHKFSAIKHIKDNINNKQTDINIPYEDLENKPLLDRKKSETKNEKCLIIKKSKESLVNHETLAQTEMNLCSSFNYYTLYLMTILIGIFTVYIIIFSKINILYSKIVYNICGQQCGFLSYRFGESFTLDYIVYHLQKISTSKYFRLDFFFFSYIFVFRALTVLKSMKIKGVSFMWHIFYPPKEDLAKYQIFLFLTIILFTGVALIYDFTYLLPDYLRFNGLNQLCDYTTIDKEYCGVSFFGLMFLKISMNFHIFMYFDILASGIFITNGIIWAFRLIINPLVYSAYTKIASKFIKQFNAEKELNI